MACEKLTATLGSTVCVLVNDLRVSAGTTWHAGSLDAVRRMADDDAARATVNVDRDCLDAYAFDCIYLRGIEPAVIFIGLPKRHNKSHADVHATIFCGTSATVYYHIANFSRVPADIIASGVATRLAAGKHVHNTPRFVANRAKRLWPLAPLLPLPLASSAQIFSSPKSLMQATLGPAGCARSVTFNSRLASATGCSIERAKHEAIVTRCPSD